MKVYSVKIEAYGHISVRRIQATSEREAREMAMDKAGIRTTVKQLGIGALIADGAEWEEPVSCEDVARIVEAETTRATAEAERREAQLQREQTAGW